MTNIENAITKAQYDELRAIATYVYKRYFFKYEYDKEDLISSGIAFMWEKSKSYDETKGTRGTFFVLVCKSAMIIYLRKIYLLTRKENCFNNESISLSSPVGEDGEDCLADFIADEKNSFDEKMNFLYLKKLVFETLEDMKEYTAKGKLKNPNLYKVVPLYIKYQSFEIVGNICGFTREFVRLCVNKFRKKFKAKLVEKEYFS